MRKNILRGLTGLLIPFAAYGAHTSYGAYQRKSFSKAISSSILYSNPPVSWQVKSPARVETDELSIILGTAVRELVIVDEAVRDKHLILKQMQPGVDIVEIKSGSDGLTALINTLAGYENLDAVHIVTHAEAGAIYLGGKKIDQQALIENISGFTAINHAIREGGDLMLYGCDLAQGDDGENFLQIIEQNTHADVAASIDKTGNEAFDGNWTLEIQKGDIETAVLSDSLALKDFSGVLFSGTIDFSQAKECGTYAGAASINAEAWTSASQEYALVVDGTNFSTDLYDNVNGLSCDYADPDYDPVNVMAYTHVNETELTLRFLNNEIFSPQSLKLVNIHGSDHNFTITSDKGDNLILAFPSQSPMSVDLSGFSKNITSITISSDKVYATVDDFQVTSVGAYLNSDPTDITLSAVSIAASDTGAGVAVGGLSTTDVDDIDSHSYSLVANGTSDNGSCGAAGDDDNASFQIDNANDELETLNTLADATYSVCLETDDGTASYQESFTITVTAPPLPTITSATYDASTGALAVTGTNLSAASGTDNDIVANKLTFVSEPGVAYTLTDTADVEITSGTSFTLALSATDRAAVNLIMNRNGPASSGGPDYNLEAAEDWAVGADAGETIADTTGNGITVSNVAVPAITSATYDASTGAIVVTGTGLLSASGASNDIVANKFTLTGEGGGTYTLTDTANVEATSSTSFTLSLSATDKAGANAFVNKNGTSSTSGTTYNLAAAEDWAAGADAAVVVADTTGNGITASNIAVPAITSATYDASTGALVVTGTGFLSLSGASNDIVANKFTLTGEGGGTYTLTDTSNVEVTSGTSFTLSLSATDKAVANAFVNKNGTSSTSGTTYNLAAAEDWAAGADAAVVVADTTGNGVTVSNVAVPTVASATYNGTTGALVVTGSGLLNLSGATNDINANKFTLTGQGGSAYTLTDTANVEITSGTSFTLTLSATDKSAVNALLNWNGTSSAGGTTYNLAAAEDWAAGAAAAVIVADLTGNGITVSDAAPAVGSVSVPANGTYITGQNLDFTINTSENITVNTGGGTPRIALTVGATTEYASYLSGNGTSALVFRYTVQAGDSDTDGIAVAANIDANGGTLQDGAGSDLNTTLNSVGSTAGVLVDAVAPTVSSVSVPANGTYTAGQSLNFTVNTDENVTVNIGGGTPQIALTLGAITRQATYLSGSGTSALVFGYTVQTGDNDADGIAVAASIVLNSGTLQDSAGNDFNTTLNSVDATTSILVDAVAPTVSSVSVPSNGTYIAGENLDFTVNTNENVTVNTGGGTPQIALTIGATTRQATYLSGNGTSALVFRYTIQAGDSDTDGIAVATSLDTNGGTLRDDAGNDLDTTLNSVGSTTSVLVDTVAPTISSVSVPSNATYITGQNLDFTVNANENVTVNTDGGTPRIALTVGATIEYASYLSGNGTSALVFRYTVQAGDSDTDGIAVAANIDANGGTLQDGAGNDLNTTLNSVGATTSVLVDAQVPTLDSSTPADNASGVAFDADIALNFSENVSAGAGSVSVYDAADDSLVESFAAGTLGIVADVVTIDLTSNLTPTHNYYVQVGSDAFEDAAGNAYAGIADETTLNFTVGNNAPVASDDSDTTDEDTAVAVDVLANDTDSDSALNAASTAIVTAPANGSTSINTATGVITYTPADDFNGGDSFTYTVGDVHGTISNTATISITVNAINDAPVAVVDGPVNTPEDTLLTIDVAANDTDVDTGDSVDTATLTIVTPPTNGSATINAGQVDYDPDADFNGTDTFTYTIEDQNGALSNTATVTINVTGVNDLPTAGDDGATVDEDDSVDVDVLDNDSDLDGTLDSTTVTVLANPANGSTSVDALTGVITYTPSANYNGSDSFTYVVQDDAGGTSNAATVTLTVNSINDAPAAANDTAIMLEDTAHEVNVLGNDSDVDGTLVPASVEVVTGPVDGGTSINATTGAITYTPNGDFSGSDSFTYRVQDNDGAWSAAVTVTMTVDNVNDPPTASDDSATLDEDASVEIDILANDTDIDDTLDATSVAVITPPTNGSANVNPDGSVTYTPAANFNGSDSFIYEVDDAIGDSSNPATVSITVDPVNDAPVISGTPATTVVQDSAYIFIPSGSDVENDTLAFSVTNLPSWASFDTASGVISGTPGNNDVGTSGSIVISASDGIDSTDLTAFTITVTNVNDAPTISGTPSTSVLQDMAYSFTPAADDLDTGDTLTFSIANQPAWASFDTASGALAGMPNNGAVGFTGNIVISVSDGTATTALPAFNLTVTNVNDAPVISGTAITTVAEDSVYSFTPTASDVDVGDVLTFSVINKPAWADFGTSTGVLTGTPTNDDIGTHTGIVITVSDGKVSDSLGFDLTVNNTNDVPVISGTPMTSIGIGGSYNFTPVGSDVDVGDPLTFSITNKPGWATFNTSTGALTGTPGETDVDTFNGIVISVSDGTLTASLPVFSIVVNDTLAPSGHSVSFADTVYNSSEAGSASFAFADAEVGATYTYTIDSSGGGTPVSGSGTVVSDADAVTGLNMSGLSDGTVTVSVTLTDTSGNAATAETATAVLDQTAPTLISSAPSDGAAGVALDTSVLLTFSEAVSAGTGNVTLYSATDDAVVEAFVAGSAAVDGSTVTVTPSAPLIPTHSYYLQADSGVFIDVAGNAYTGIADKTTLNFTVANAAPLANADLANVAEDTSVDIRVLVNDTDNDSSLNAASVTVVGAPQNGTTSVNTASGVVTYTPTANYNGADTFTYTVEDVYSSLSNVATVNVTIAPVNDAPIAVADITSTAEDNPVSIDVVDNDTDTDTADTTPDSLNADSITIVSGPAHGTASVVDGQVLYTPHLDYNGSDNFTYTIDDASGATSNVVTALINVTGVNDLPTAVADTATVAEDGSVDIEVLVNDSDLDGSLDATSVSVLAVASHGTTSLDALTGVITYTPTGNYHGTDTFTYVVQDDAGGSASATVTVTVTSVNDVPMANADTATLQEDVAHTINVLGNDTDLDGTLVLASVQMVTAAGQGTTSVNPGTGAIIYTPGENFNGSDTFTYRVQDNEGAWSTPASVTITVEDVNDEPLANNDAATTDEDTEITIDLLGNDSDVDGTLDPVSLTLTQPANGTVTDNADGTVTYNSVANFFGTDSFTYTVTDDDGGISNSATVTVTVDPVNDTPVISGTPAVTVAQDAAYSFTPMASDVDADTTLTFSITDQPEWASFNPTTGALTGTPGNDDVGDYSGIVITVSDGLLSASLPAFAIEVANVNDAPEISGAPVGTVNQGGTYSFAPNVVDVDANTTLTFSVQNLPHWASFNPSTGAITGTPANSDVGTYNNIVISVSDGVTTTTLAGFDISVANVNDPPVVLADSYSLDEGGLLQPNARTGVLANDSDIDGDNLIAILVNGPRHASEFSWNENGSFRYQHNGTETRSDSFTYRISDGTVNSSAVTVSLNITAINDAPVFVTQPPLVVVEGGVYSYDVGVTDPDSTVSLSLQDGAPDWLVLDGFRLSGTAPINEVGAVSVVLRATDDEYTVDQTYDLTVLEREASLVTISTNWRGLPSVVDNTVDLQITLTHASGPAVLGALQVSLEGLDSAATMVNCTSVNQDFACPVNLATGASAGFRLRVTPEEEGNLVVVLGLNSAGEQLASAITDVSVTERAVSQGNVTFNLANATALASINLLNDGTRELVAGTNLGDTVKLLNYTLTSGSAQVLSEINNRGYTERVRVADIDQDGLEDILVVNRSGDASDVYYDRGDEFVAEAGSVTLPHGREALLRDLNDDGYPELILGAGGFNLYIYENNEGIYDIPPLVFSSPASIIHFALLRRLPTDAPLEGTLVISSAAAVQLVRFGLDPDNSAAKPSEGEGASVMNEKFTLLREIPLSGVSTIQLVDVDGDGREEIIASTTHQNDAAENSGVTIIGITDDDQLQPIARLGAASAKNVEVADFNGDGIADLLVANVNNSYQFYRGTGNPANWTLTNTILYHSSTLVIPEDVNNDGLADVLIYEDGDEQVELYLSAPDGDTGETADLILSATTRVVRNDRYHFEYAVSVVNEGLSIAEQPRVIVPLPDGVDAVTLPDYCTEDEEVDEVTCNLQDLAPGAGQVIPLILAGDWRINNLNLTAQTTSDALETDIADNTATTSLGGMFEYKRARIKGGGGSVNLLWFGALMGLAFARRRREKLRVGHTLGGKSLSFVLPFTLAAGLLNAPVAEAASPEPNSYVEGSLGLISSDWDMMTFYYDLSDSTQEAVLVEKDDQRFGWQLLYGYRIHSRIALELGYLDSGQTELEVETVVSETDALHQVLIDHAPVAGDGPYAGLRFSFVDRDQHEIYAKVGLWSWSAGYALTLGEQTEWVKRSGEDWLVGLGFSLPVLERLDLGGSIQTTTMDNDRLIFFGINLNYQFDVGR